MCVHRVCTGMFRYVCAFFAKLAAYKPGGGGFRYVCITGTAHKGKAQIQEPQHSKYAQVSMFFLLLNLRLTSWVVGSGMYVITGNSTNAQRDMGKGTTRHKGSTVSMYRYVMFIYFFVLLNLRRVMGSKCNSENVCAAAKRKKEMSRYKRHCKNRLSKEL
jgi:hypothetical protein